ncbi:pilus assembly PilX family protein [Sinimarinibacterium thermocellulolyticum]|uniref:PilX N-terminal domain-containing pilus assembly protein n=1 Tax=Sinimarinibacterium thermocellulolyticum TaxID=3170016 RepID=A0ABV2A8Z5_9GAMM
MSGQAAPRCPRPLRQAGIALATALILLVVITLIGLAAVRGTTVQQKMTANFQDRSIAFEAAEAALNAASRSFVSGTQVIARNCAAGGVACRANPFTDPTLDSSRIQTVPASLYAGIGAAGQPQYVIEFMGEFPNPDLNTGFNQSANAAQYGAQGTNIMALYYRITARSADPAVVGERAVVTLQTMYRQ